MGGHQKWLRSWICGRLGEVMLQLGVDYDGLSIGSFVSMGTTYTLCRVLSIHTYGPCPRSGQVLVGTSQLDSLLGWIVDTDGDMDIVVDMVLERDLMRFMHICHLFVAFD